MSAFLSRVRYKTIFVLSLLLLLMSMHTYLARAATVGNPAFSIASGGYASSQNVTITSITEGAVICYTTDGSDPAATTPGTCNAGSTTYSGPIDVSSTMTIKAIATLSGYDNSVTTSATYIIGNFITFTTSGATFAPIITADGATAQWVFGDGQTSSSVTPSITFSGAASRVNYLQISPWNAVTKINLGYDANHGGSRTGDGADTFASLAQQNVTSVSGLGNVSSSLIRWASDDNPITGLDFTNFTSLTTIECHHCAALTSATLTGASAISRLNIEDGNLSGPLDVSDSPNLTDMRASSITPDGIVWPTGGEPNLITLSLHDNAFSSIDISGLTGLRNVELYNNNLTGLDITGITNLNYIDLRTNYLTQASIDDILQTLDGFGTENGYLNVTGTNNALPSMTGQQYMNNLISRGWTVNTNGTILTLSKAGTGGTGTITMNDGITTISCGTNSTLCKVAAAIGTTITLSAAADGGSTFTGWTGGGCSGTGTCAITLSADTLISAGLDTTASGIRGPITYSDNYASAVGTAISAPARVHTQGNLIAVFAGAFQSATDFSVSDTQGNAYTAVGTRYVADNSSITGQWFYTFAGSTGLNTVTATSGNSNRTIRVLEYAGIDPGTPLDSYATNTTSPTTAITTTSPNELILVGWHVEGAYSCSAGSNYSLNPDDNCYSGGVARPVTQRIVSSLQTSVTTTLSVPYKKEYWAGVSRNWVVSFRGIRAGSPSFSVPAGTYVSAQSIALSSATSGAAICYTTDGTIPGTDGAGNCSGASTSTYSGAISVSSMQTIKAVSTKSGINDSAVSTASYVIGTGIQGPITHAAVAGNSTGAGTVSTAATMHTAGNMLAVFTGGVNPSTIAVTDTQGNIYHAIGSPYASSGIVGQWFYAFVGTTGTNTVTATFGSSTTTYRTIRVLEYANIDPNNPLDIGPINNTWPTGTLTADSTAYSTASPNELILAAWHGEGVSTCTAGDGFTLLPYDYCGSGIGRPVEQKIVSSIQTDAVSSFTITGSVAWTGLIRGWTVTFREAPVAAPIFSVPAGTYIPSQGVSLSSTTSGATICYTTNGSDPTAPTAGTCGAGSSTYSTPISIDEGTTTLKAIATKAGMNNSAVTSAAYTITNVMTFTTVGATFAPIITVTGTPTILWTFSDSTTSDSVTPSKDFGSTATRSHTLKVTPWSALTKINLGYDGIDGGTTPGTGENTFASLTQQNVSAVSGLELVKDSLALWASSYNPITSLDFSDFTALTKVECYDCGALTSIDIDNVSTLVRLGLEKDNLSSLDLTDAVNLADLRGSDQDDSTFTITWGAGTYSSLWHVCAWGNPNGGQIPIDRMPILRELYIGGDNQAGALNPISTNLRSVLANDNGYTSADFSGNYPAGANGIIDMDNNDLTSIDISDSPGLVRIDLHANPLSQSQIDAVLHNLDSFGVVGDGTGTSSYDDPYYVNLTSTSAPSAEGQAHADNLTARGWTILTDQVTLTVSRAGTGGTGTITGGSIDCGSTCSASVDPGDSVTLTATPDETSTFTGWAGGGCSGTGTCTVTVNTDTTVAAIFGTTASGIQGPIAHSAVAGNSTGAGTVSAAATMHTAGNMLAVFTGGVNPSTITVTDMQGNTYHAIGSPYASSGIVCQWFYAFVGTTGTNTVTATFGSSTTTYRSIRVLEYANIDPDSPVDISDINNSYTGNLTSATSSAFTTSYPNELILAAWMADGVTTCTGGDGYTLLPNTFCGAGVGRPVEEKKVSTIQTDLMASFNITGIVAWTGINRSWIVSFKAAKSATPAFSVPAGTYTSPQSVVLSSATEGATICYTLDGTDPSADGAGTCINGITYVSAISVSNSESIKALSTISGYNDSTISSASYTINSVSGGGSSGGTIILKPTVISAKVSSISGNQVKLALSVTNVDKMSFSDTENFTNAAWVDFSSLAEYTKSEGQINLYLKFRSASGAISSVIELALTSPDSSEEESGGENDADSVSSCPDGTLLKLPDSPKIYVVTDGQKKWISTPEVFEQLGYHWTAVVIITPEQLAALPDSEDNLIRAKGDYKVYLIVNGVKRHIPNPTIFLDYGFAWEDVKDVSQETVNKYSRAYLIRESRKNEIYFISSNGIRKHIPNMDVFNSFGDKLEDVQIVSKTEMDFYPESKLIKLDGGNDIYLVEGQSKRLISSPQVFEKLNLNWNYIIGVNEFEFNFYTNGENII